MDLGKVALDRHVMWIRTEHKEKPLGLGSLVGFAPIFGDLSQSGENRPLAPFLQ